MRDANYIWNVLVCMLFCMLVFAGAMNYFEKFVPAYLTQLARYGKSTSKRKSYFTVEVPKSWFRHFYVYASAISSAALFCCVFRPNSPPQWLVELLDDCVGSNRPIENHARVLLALTFFTLHCLRRMYETHYTSVFGEKGRINILHYIVAYLHYFVCVLIILSGSPSLSKGSQGSASVRSKWEDLNYVDLLATVLYLWASHLQHEVAQALANLRKNAKGVVTSEDHKLPNGGWFEYVSNPHMLAEVMIYASIALILWTNGTWKLLSVWVFGNQVEQALFNHWWYRENFKDLPKHRKAIIPFVL